MPEYWAIVIIIASCKCYRVWYPLRMGKMRRGNYIFLTWVGDHSPRHVHVYQKSRLVVKWDLENKQVMEGMVNRRLIKLIEELDSEGVL